MLALIKNDPVDNKIEVFKTSKTLQIVFQSFILITFFQFRETRILSFSVAKRLQSQRCPSVRACVCNAISFQSSTNSSVKIKRQNEASNSSIKIKRQNQESKSSAKIKFQNQASQSSVKINSQNEASSIILNIASRLSSIKRSTPQVSIKIKYHQVF